MLFCLGILWPGKTIILSEVVDNWKLYKATTGRSVDPISLNRTCPTHGHVSYIRYHEQLLIDSHVTYSIKLEAS